MRKELLNEIENDYWNEKADPIDMAEIFDLANKALEQTSWIPVSERLPLENARVIVTNGERVNVGWVDKDNYPYWMLEEDGCNYSDIIAWMPLPQPYTESEDRE